MPSAVIRNRLHAPQKGDVTEAMKHRVHLHRLKTKCVGGAVRLNDAPWGSGRADDRRCHG